MASISRSRFARMFMFSLVQTYRPMVEEPEALAFNACVNKKYFCPDREIYLQLSNASSQTFRDVPSKHSERHLIAVGDSVMVQYVDAYKCLYRQRIEFHFAGGFTSPICEALKGVALNSSTVLLLNTGIWYNSKKQVFLGNQLACLRKEVLAALQLHPGLRVWWVQSVAQHFPTQNGNYKLSKAPARCQEFNKVSKNRKRNFRWKHVQESLLQGMSDMISVIPVWEITAPLYFDHLGHTKYNGDCTHFCDNFQGVPYYIAKVFRELLFL